MRPAHRLPRWMAIVAISLAGAGCATLASPELEGAESAHRPEAAAPPATEMPDRAPLQALPPEVSEALLPPLRVPFAEEPAADEPRFDLAVKEAPAPGFFMNLVEGTPYDVVVHPEVGGTISLTLKDATIPEVLDAVREVYGYELQRTPKGFFVLPPGLQSRVFRVDYPHLHRAGRSQTRVSGGQLSERSGGVEDDSAGESATTIFGSRSGSVVESSQVTTDSEVDFWGELTSILRAIIGSEEGRSVVASPQAGMVVVRAMPAELRQVGEFLSRARVSLRRQVILEAKILEVQLEDEFRAGINWALLIESGTNYLLASQTGGASLLGDVGVSDIAGETGILDPRSLSQVSNTKTSAFGGLFSLVLNFDHFTAFLELLEAQGRVRVLSNPRISTLNNQKAVIKVGSDEFFVTDVSSTTIAGTTPITTPQVTLTPFFSGIALDVTPQISESEEVILHIHPSVSKVVDQTKVIELADKNLTLPLALSTIRESDSIVLARSGQMIVIGGLMQELSRDLRAAWPVLGKIPYLGGLFRQTREESEMSELVILLRVTVVGADTWDNELTRVERRLELPPYGLEPGVLSAEEERRPAP